MNKDKKTANPTLEKIKIWLSAAIFVVAVVMFYLQDGQATWRRTGALVLGIVLAVVVMLFAEPGRRFISYFRDSWGEMRKVVWPTRKETLQMTLFVFGFVVVLAIFLWGMDSLFSYVLYDIVLGWR